MSGVPLIDFSPLGDLPKVYNDARDRATLADLGAILANPNGDYRAAAGLAAKANRLDLALPLIAQARQREAAATVGPLLSDLVSGQGNPTPQAPGAQPFAPAAASPAPASPDQRGIAAGPDPQLARGLRNNNPLNIEAGVFTQSQPGFAGSDGRFARFETPQHGVDAAGRLLDVYATKYGLNTVNSIVGRWAPDGENDARGYAASVAGRLGIDPDQPMNIADPNVKGALLSAMARFENGRPMPSGGGGATAFGMAKPDAQGAFDANAVMLPQDQPQPVRLAQAGGGAPIPNTSAPPQQTAPGAPSQPNSAQTFPPQAARLLAAIANPDLPDSARQSLMLVLQRMLPEDNKVMNLPDGTIVAVNARTNQVTPIYQGAKPSFGVIGKDSNGNDVHGFIDVTTKKAWDVNGSPIDTGKLSGMGQGNPSVTGDAFLQTIDPGRANQIKAIVDGRMAPPGGMSLKSPQIQGLMRDVAQYEPGFDLTTWTARNKTRADFASGKMGQNLSSFNTVVQHLEALDKAVDGLNNTSYPWGNAIGNMVRTNVGDTKTQAALANFETARTAVASELTRAFRGASGNVADIVDWNQKLNATASPEALHQAVKAAVELLRGRIEAVGDQYSRGMGKTTDPLSLLSPKAAAGIQRLSGEGAAAPSATPAPSAPQIGAPPDRAAVEAARADPAGTLQQARDAIAAGKPRDAVVYRLQELGINASGL